MRILGSDYDGTLNHNGIDEKKKKALETWHNKGNVFALISGRPRDNILQLYKEQQFPCDYLIANNGAVIMKTDGTVISETRCDGRLIVPLLKLMFEKSCSYANINTCFPCVIYADSKDCKESYTYTLENMPEILYFNQISTILPDIKTAETVIANIREKFGDMLNPLQNGPCIDIVRADMNKAKGLYILMEYLGAKFDDVIAVGDNLNDSDMIREFKSYAMENGVDAIKELADHVTPGVTELIEWELNDPIRREMSISLAHSSEI